MQSIQREIIGHHLTLRLVETADAQYIWDCRNDPLYNTHLSKASGSVADQQAWITRYKDREAAGSEYYFVIFRNDNNTRCGTVRLYDIDDKKFTWGSWILDQNKPHKAALDSAIQVYRFGFGVLNAEKSVFDVRKDNVHTLKFHDRFGSQRTHEDDLNVYYELPKNKFPEIEKTLGTYFKKD